jgi:hypothetical protein
MELPSRDGVPSAPVPSILSSVSEGLWHGFSSLSSRPTAPSESGSETTSTTPSETKQGRLSLSDRLRSSLIPEGASSVASSAGHRKTLSLRDYASQFRDSDTAATFSKFSSNWRAMAFDKLSGQTQEQQKSTLPTPPKDIFTAIPKIGVEREDEPPERPAKFRAPRESWSPYSRRDIRLHDSPDSAVSLDETPWTERIRNADLERGSRTPSPGATDSIRRKRGPKPLLLNASNLMTSDRNSLIIRSATSSPVNPQSFPPETLLRRSELRDSLSSLSSYSDSRRNSEYDFSRKAAPLRRSTAATGFRSKVKESNRKSHTLAGASLDEYSSLEHDFESRQEKPANHWNGPESPGTGGSSPVPSTPGTSIHGALNGLNLNDSDAYDGVEDAHQAAPIAYSDYYQSREANGTGKSHAHSRSEIGTTSHSLPPFPFKDGSSPSDSEHEFANDIQRKYRKEVASPTPRAGTFDTDYARKLLPKSPTSPRRMSASRQNTDESTGFDDILSGY